MRTALVFALGCLALGPSVARADPPAARCDVGSIKDIRSLTLEFSKRAVDVVRFAGAATPLHDNRLERLIEPSASFSLGAGDVGRPMGTGIPGAQALARTMKADSYRFATWSGVPGPVNQPCARHDVEVDFIDTSRSNSFPVKFTFENARVVQASGWTVSFTSGALTAPPE